MFCPPWQHSDRRWQPGRQGGGVWGRRWRWRSTTRWRPPSRRLPSKLKDLTLPYVKNVQECNIPTISVWNKSYIGRMCQSLWIGYDCSLLRVTLPTKGAWGLFSSKARGFKRSTCAQCKLVLSLTVQCTLMYTANIKQQQSHISSFEMVICLSFVHYLPNLIKSLLAPRFIDWCTEGYTQAQLSHLKGLTKHVHVHV